MKYLKKYESREDIDTICQRYGIRNYIINGDGSIDISGSVYLGYEKLIEFPLKFRSVVSYFNCQHNDLTNLEGCPKSVGDYFSCGNNNLTNLVGCPKSVGGYFNCLCNQIETFEGLDFIHIGGNFYCFDNPIFKVWNLFLDHTKFEFFNDCDIIREDRVIILDRLNFFLDYIDKPTVQEVESYRCV